MFRDFNDFFVLSRTSASVLSESPYKLARNLVRSIPDGAGRDQYRNSINRHLSDGGRHPSRRHPRRRHRNNRTNSVGGGELIDGNGFNRKRNKDLVKQLNAKRSTKKHKKNKSKKGRKKKPKSEEEIQRRRERRRRRKQEKKRRQRERKQRQRQLRRLERRRLRKEQLLQQQQDDGEESNGHHLKVRSADSTPSPSSSGKCHFKLIDRCSWPHCNRSCPKLKNPDTGKSRNQLNNNKIVKLDCKERLQCSVASLTE